MWQCSFFAKRMWDLFSVLRWIVSSSASKWRQARGKGWLYHFPLKCVSHAVHFSIHQNFVVDCALHFYKYRWDMQLMNSPVEDEGKAAEWCTERSCRYRWNVCWVQGYTSWEVWRQKGFISRAGPAADTDCVCTSARVCLFAGKSLQFVFWYLHAALRPSVRLRTCGQVHTSGGNEARHGCVIQFPPHDRGCSYVSGTRS